MKKQWGVAVRLVSVLAIFSLLCSGIVSAGEIPDMMGTWNTVSSEFYSIPGGYENSTSSNDSIVVSTQDNRMFFGEETYLDPLDDKAATDHVVGVVSEDGNQFWMDHQGSGLSYGERVSDNEWNNYLLLPDQGPMAMVNRMIKEGTSSSTDNRSVPNLVGTWDYVNTYDDMNHTVGSFTVDSQKGRVFSGISKHIARNGEMFEVHVVGAISDNGNIYAVTDGHYGIWTGNLVTNDAAHVVITIPNDKDKIYTVDRWLFRNGTEYTPPEVTYPDISGNYLYLERNLIQNGTITKLDIPPDEGLVIQNQTGQFFTVIKNFNVSHVPPTLELKGMFIAPDKTVIIGSGRAFLIYHVLKGEDGIESIEIRNEENPGIYLNKLIKAAT